MTREGAVMHPPQKKGTNMKKIKTRHDLNIPGWGKIPAGTQFKVLRFNKRFIYVMVNDRVELRLARKTDCEIVY